MKRLSPSDAMFLYGESREQMFHVAGLMPFTPGPNTRPEDLRELMDQIRASAAESVQRPWNLRLKTPDFLFNPLQAWVPAETIDIDYHVRRSALPSPGDERELGILVSRLHGYHIDFHRPPWETHLIEGLEGGRFALYVKVHHSLVDGFTAMRILQTALSTDPNERDRPLFFAIPPPARSARPDGEGTQYEAVMSAVREQYSAAKVATRALKRVFDSARSGDHDLVTPRQAPKSILNARISQSRRFATQRLEMARLKAIAKAADGTLNDVVLALCAGSLRAYLLEQGALPSEPLIAMVPVSVRAKDDAGGGNSVGAILANLATDVEAADERLVAIIDSTRHAKQQLQGMSKAAIIQYSAMLIAPSMLQMLPQTAGHVKPTFNVVISNVPGPDHPLYFRGARLEATYPMSIPLHGQALNITCNSYDGMMCFGFTGCRDTLPHLQRLAVYCADAMTDLEQAFQ